MLENVKHTYKGKIMALAGVIGLAAVIGLTLTPVSNANAAPAAENRECHVFNSAAKVAWYEGGFFISPEYTVPSSSECLDINIRNVKNSDPAIAATDPDKYCTTFKVAMYPQDKTKPVYYSKEKRVCSKDPSSSSSTNGPVVPIATAVKNGTKYRVLHKATDLEKRVTYQVVD